MTVIHKKFQLDKAILRSIIAEQAGEVVKALAEMIMNSIDAGATRIDVEIDAHKFKISDDGRGFKSLQEIEDNFGTFGTPRETASEYGCFRIGRGQILNISKTYWRSAHYSMTVDLEGAGEDAYELGEHEEFLNGCVITGEFYTSLNIHEGVQNVKIFENDLAKGLAATKKQKDIYKSLKKKGFVDKLIKFFSLVETPIVVNDVQISNLIKPELIKETEIAKYYKSPLNSNLMNFNKGIYISDSTAHDSLIVDYKQSPVLNMARNQINRDCKIFNQSERERAEYIIELATKGVQTNSIGLFVIYSHFLEKDISTRNLSVFEEHLYSLINRDNIKSIMNSIPVHTYNNGKVDVYGFLDFCEMSQAMPSNFVFNNYNQRKVLENIPVSATFNFLADHDESRIIVSSSVFDTNDICFNLARYMRSFDPDFSLKVDITRHTLFLREDEFASYRKKVKPKSKEHVGIEILDKELAELTQLNYISVTKSTIEKNETLGTLLNQVTLELKQAIVDVANDIQVALSPEMNIHREVRVIIAYDYASNVFEHNDKVYLVLDGYRLDRHIDISSAILSMLMGSIGDLPEHFVDIYDAAELNETCVEVIEHFNAFGVDDSLSNINNKIYSIMPPSKLEYENRNRIKTIHAVAELLKGVDIEAYNTVRNHSKAFNTIAV